MEITIPLSRVNRLEDIAVEIENFDVDLLSARSLNITGVLSLQGIETSSLVTERREWGGREFTAEHDTVQDNRSDAEIPQFGLTEESSEGRDTDEQEDAEEVLSWTEDSSELLSPTLWADKEYGVPESVEVVAEPEYTPESNSNVWFKEKVFTTSRVNQTAEVAEIAQAAEQHQHEQVSADLGPEDAIPVDAEVQFETTEDVQEDLEAVASVQVEEKKELKLQ